MAPFPPPEPPLPLSPLEGLLLPLGGGGGIPDVLGFVDGGVDCVGQVALASITDPSGHVFVVGGVVIDGVKDWLHDGSVGFFVQSTDGGVPEVQLFTHVPDPPDNGIDVLLEAADDEHVVLPLQVGSGDDTLPKMEMQNIPQNVIKLTILPTTSSQIR